MKAAAVVCRPVEDGAVLLQVEDEVYFGLNRVGLQVWQMMATGCSDVDELCTRLSAHYPDIPSVTLREDVMELLEQLRTAKLVVEAPDASN